jgi:hypothetical protein
MMRIFLATISFVLSALFYTWLAAIFLYPVYIVGWAEGWRIAREWQDWAAAAVIGTKATALLYVGESLVSSGRNRPHLSHKT